MSFDDKVVLVTGASSGIGAATAIHFAKEGANVAIVGRNQNKLDAVSKEMVKYGKTPLVLNADVSKDDDVERIITDTIAKFGKLDVLVNNAGIGTNGFILDGKLVEAYDTVMNVNVRAVIHLTTFAAPHLIATKGNVINISSAAAMSVPAIPSMTAYHISKAALDHFTRGAALELASSGVRVNSVNPGPVVTDFMENAGINSFKWEDISYMTALNRVSKPEEIADMVLFLASEKAKGITGSCVVADNGFLLKTT